MTTTWSPPAVETEPVAGSTEPNTSVATTQLSKRDLLLRWLRGRVAPVGTAIVALVLWQLLVSTGIPPSSIASPTQAWGAFAEDPGKLWFHITPTLSAALKGFGIATSLAILVSLVTVVFPRLKSPVYNASVVTYSVPLIALAPVLLVWIGNGAGLRITIAAIAGFFPVVVGCMQGFSAPGPARLELMDQLSASRAQRFRLLTIPESLPFIFAGLKVAAASSVLGAIISEWSGADRGLGLAMINALSGYKPSALWMIIIASTALTISIYSIVALVERLVIRWDYDQSDMAADTVTSSRDLVERGPVLSVIRAAAPWVVGAVTAVVLWILLLELTDTPAYLAAPPPDAFAALLEDWSKILDNLLYTLVEAGAGLLVSTTLALTFATLFTVVPTAERSLMPLALTVRSIPIVAIAPLLVLVAGRGLRTAIVCVTIVTFFPILVLAVKGFRSLPNEVVELFQVHGAGEPDLFRYARIPYAVPFIFTGLRVAGSKGVLGAMLAEWLTGNQGLGALLVWAAGRREIGLLWATLVVATVSAIVIFQITGATERRITRRMMGTTA